MSRPDLVALLDALLADPVFNSDAFFKALPEGTVHVHAPLSDDHARLRLIQFYRPDGVKVLPVFIAREKAEVAAQNAVRIIEIEAAELIRSMPGATWMIDPNDAGCTLTPEDLASIYLFGQLERFAIRKGAGSTTRAALVPAHDENAEQYLSVLFRNFDTVTEAYLYDRVETDGSLGGHYIVFGVAAADSEFAAKAVWSALLVRQELLREPIGVLDYDPASGLPDYVLTAGGEPFFRARGRKAFAEQRAEQEAAVNELLRLGQHLERNG